MDWRERFNLDSEVSVSLVTESGSFLKVVEGQGLRLRLSS